MAAKKTRRRIPTPGHETADIQQIFRLHLEASRRRDELLAEARLASDN
jgi:hypothetical protein